MSLFSGVEQRVLCRFLLTLTHGNVGELLVGSGDVILGGNSFNFGGGINTGEEYKEERNSLIRLSKGLKDVEGRLFDISLVHHLSDKAVKG